MQLSVRKLTIALHYFNIKDRIVDHINVYDLLNEYKHWFVSKRSCLTICCSL